MGINGSKELLRAFLGVFNYVKSLYKEILGILFPFLDDGVLHTHRNSIGSTENII